MSKSHDHPIPKVSVATLAAAAQPGQAMDEGSSKLLDEELKTLTCRRMANELESPCVKRDPEEDPKGRILRTDLTGIALSGGGIRSATFCLGVLQELAKAGLLKRFDYLSTVSGGGYIGSSVTWWLSDESAKDPQVDRPPFGLKRDDFPYGVDGAANVDPKIQPQNAKQAGPRLLDYLRKHGNYLTPGEGITFWSGVGVAIRAMFINLFVWIPLITMGFLFLYWFPRSLFPRESYDFSFHYFYSGGLVQNRGKICSAETSWDACLSRVLSHDFRIVWEPLLPLFSGDLGFGAAALAVVFWDALLIVGIIVASALAYYGVTKSRESSKWRRLSWWFWWLARWFWLWRVLWFWRLAPLFGWVAALVRFLARWFWMLVIVGSSAAVLLYAPPELPAGFQRDWLLILAAILAGTFGILCLIYSFLSYLLSKSTVWFGKSDTADPKSANGTNRRFARIAKVGEGLASSCRAGARGGREFGYEMRRLFESWAGVYLFVFAVLLVVGSVPVVADWLRTPAVLGAQPPPTAPGLGIGSGFAALLAGLAATIAAFLRSGAQVGDRLRAMGFQVPGGFTATLAAALLLFGVLVISYQASFAILSGAISPLVAFWILAAAVFFGGLVNTNHTSLGRFYRDRLLEAFMPAYEAAIRGRTEAAPQAAERMRLYDASKVAPYHIINTNVVLVRAEDRRRRLRGGDSFILTRDYCGSNATGWCRTKEFMAGRMTVPTAMAISGAAANPNTGVGGVGLTRSKVVSALMALVNLRLGHWVPHPIEGNQNAIPNHFRPGFTSFFVGSTEDCKFQELTDGGHFDNLGIYELVRRRLRLILVCDGAADPGFQFGDLQMALHRIKEDFGATIDFCDNYGIESLIPERVEGATYPKGLEQAKRGFAVAKIRYASDLDAHGTADPDARPAWLVYLKSTIVPDLPLELRGYRGREVLFPNQSTGDQFFDEDQFEAYRQLGQQLADAMIKELHLDQGLPKDRTVPDQARCNPVSGRVEEIAEQVREAVRESADDDLPVR